MFFPILGYLVIAEFLLYGVFPHAPGMVQRLIITTGHLSIGWLSWVLLGLHRTKTGPATGHPAPKRLSENER